MGDLKHRKSAQDQDTLRVRARERIDKGLLPRAKAARTWGGRGSGLTCCLCDNPIVPSDPEMELEFEPATDSQSLRFHLQCHSIWDAERRQPIEGAWAAVENSLPPFDMPIEARLGMGGGRTVVLGIMRMKSRGNESVWINAMTRSPLPAAWTPLEWRYPLGTEKSSEPDASSTPKRA
jgi:hypothetical protein